jgi:hypothetical protein
MLERWSADLARHGFTKLAKGVFTRGSAAIRPSIREQPSRASRGSVNLLLAVELLDPHRDPPVYETALVGSLHPGRVAISDFEGAAAWDDDAAALRALVEHGIPWLDELTVPERLIAHLETVLRDGIIMAGQPPGMPPRRPPVYHLYLSLLYESTDVNRAREHATAWLEKVSRSKQPDEPQRTLRQLATLDTGA